MLDSLHCTQHLRQTNFMNISTERFLWYHLQQVLNHQQYFLCKRVILNQRNLFSSLSFRPHPLLPFQNILLLFFSYRFQLECANVELMMKSHVLLKNRDKWGRLSSLKSYVIYLTVDLILRKVFR